MRTHHRRATVTIIPEKVAHLATDDFSNILQCIDSRISSDGKIQVKTDSSFDLAKAKRKMVPNAIMLALMAKAQSILCEATPSQRPVPIFIQMLFAIVPHLL